MNNYERIYGVKFLTFTEEIELAKTKPFEAQTRNNKIRLVHTAQKMIDFAEFLKEYVKDIPEENDEKHANLVQKLADDMNSILKSMEITFHDDVYTTF